MSALFTIEELVEATGGYAENINADFITSISIDSRSLIDGALYVAIKGERFDGHEFVHKAVAGGAVVALVNKKKARDLAGLPLIIVPDPLLGLQSIARAARARSNAKIVAVTGSVGKTTTKSMVALMLAEFGETHASIKSYNNHWGVPLMLANMPISAQFGVFEIGMNHGGEITPLVKLVRPHVALVTNIGPAHIGNFDDQAGIARAKAEIIDGIEPGGSALVNADHDFLGVFQKSVKVRGDVCLMTFGFSKSAEVGIFDFFETSSGSKAQVRFGADRVNFVLGISGAHMISNAAGAICIAHQLALDFSSAVRGLSKFVTSAGRGQTVEYGDEKRSLTLIDESYNANPASMGAVLEVFARAHANGGQKILVLGDMLELGSMATQLHMDLLDAIVSSGADRIILIGEQMGGLVTPLSQSMQVQWALKADEIASDFALSLDFGDIIMVKGSLGMGLAQIVSAIHQRFNGSEMA